jgi:iron complex outermembrane receptor protein
LNNDRSYNDFQDYNTSGGDYVVDTNASYNYSYTDNTYAAYTSYSDKIGSHFSYMAGLRFEQYDYTGHLLNDNTSFSYRNTGFYPSLFLTEKVGDNSEFHLNYSRRVNHPEWWQMTPWTNYSNPQNPQRGNPAVQSENTNLGELAFNTTISGVSVNSTLYVKNTLSPIISYNMPLSGDTLLSTFENAKSTNTYGAELVVKVPILNWWTTTANLNAFQTSINADNLADGLSNSGFSWFGKVSSEMKIVHIYTFQVTGNYNAANVIAQGKVMASGGVDAALKRDFLKNNSGTLVLSVSDIFNTQQYRTITSSPGSFIQNALTKPITRVFKVNFTYTFGKEKNGERKKATSVSTD